MSVAISDFGCTRNGETVQKYLLQQGDMAAEIITYGATLTALRVPGKDGEPVDVVLGYTSVAAYEESAGYLGATVGRYANRIQGAAFTLDGVRYALKPNEGTKQLHGGLTGFSYRVFQAEQVGESAVRFRYQSADGEEGYPGNLDVAVTYTLTDRALILNYEAVTDKATVVNLTNHSYFNLNGGGTAMNHMLFLNADAFTPVGSDSIPVDRSMSVEGTPFDFREEKQIGRDIEVDDVQLRNTSGYDHSFHINGEGMRLCARLKGDLSGITMETWTDLPAVQFYAGNFLYADYNTKSGEPYGRRTGICLETQFPPDSPNHLDWCDVVLRPEEIYKSTTEYRFL